MRLDGLRSVCFRKRGWLLDGVLDVAVSISDDLFMGWMCKVKMQDDCVTDRGSAVLLSSLTILQYLEVRNGSCIWTSLTITRSRNIMFWFTDLELLDGLLPRDWTRL